MSSAGARAATRYTKKESDIQATQTPLTKPQPRGRDEKRRPALSAEDVFGGVGEKVKSITEEQIRVMQRLIDNTNDTDSEKPDLLFRLAELYNEQQHYYNFRARELDQKIYDAKTRGDQAQVNQLASQQLDYQNKEKQWLLAAVKQYLEVADHPDRYSSYRRMDEVLFYLAYLLTQVKKEDAARKYFKRLIKDYPTSRFIADAYLSFGEYFFENKDIENALKFYDKVLQYPQSRVFGYAKYKEGWCYFNLGDFKQALTTFVSVIDMAQRGQGAGSRSSRIALEREAKKDSVRSYAQIGSPDKAWPFFQRIGGDYAFTMLEQLAELYNAQGKFHDSIKVYRQLMSLQPGSPKLCLWQAEVVKNTLSATGSRAAGETVKELQRLAAVYERVRSTPLKADVLAECRDATANTIRELATVWHKEAQKTNNTDTYALAQYLYKEYLTRFQKEKDVYIMTFYYAELLFKLGSLGENQKYCEAAPIYTRVVEQNPSPQAKYLKESAYAAVISWKNCLAIEDTREDAQKSQVEKRQEGKQERKDKFAPKPIPDRWKKMLLAFDTYIRYVPDSAELAKIKYRKARVYYEYDHIDEAIPLFRDVVDDVIKRHREDPEGLSVFSANLLLDCYAIKRDFASLRESVDEFLATPTLIDKDAAFKQQLAALKVSSIRLEIQETEREGKYKEAGTLYNELANDHPDDPRLDEVLFNEAVSFEKARLIGLAINARQQLIKARPDSPLAKKAFYLVGRNYQDIAAYEAAAENYEAFAAKWPGEKEAPAALMSASFFRRGLGQNEKSIEDTSLFLKNYGPRREFTDRAAGVAFDEGQIFEQQKDWARLGRHFQDYLKQWGARGGVDRQLVAHVKLGEIAWRNSCTVPGGGVNGACLEVTRTRAGGAARVAEKSKARKVRHAKRPGLPGQCGPETKSKITVYDRKPQLVREAMAHFAEALKLWRGGAGTKNVPGKDETERNARVQAMGYFAAEAKMIEGDLEYEKFLRMKIPEKLDFSPAPPGASPRRQKEVERRLEDSKRKFRAWLDSKTRQLEVAQRMYQSVILFKQAHWAIGASARIGQLFQDFSGQLYTAPVPKSGPPPPGMVAAEFEQLFHDAYCDAMTDQAEPLEAKAIEGLGTCLAKSTELSWFNEWSKLCEEELNQIKPNEYPLASEIRAEPGYLAAAADQAPVVAQEIGK